METRRWGDEPPIQERRAVALVLVVAIFLAADYCEVDIAGATQKHWR